MTRTPLRCVALLLALALATVAASCQATDDDEVTPVRIGVGSTVEQQMLAALTQVALDRSGIPTLPVPDLGDTVDVRVAALTDQIDLFWGYTGAAWTLGLQRAQPPVDPDESFEVVQAADRPNDLKWLTPSAANATLALFVRATDRPEGAGGTLSWLAGRLAVAEGGLCADPAFLDDPRGYLALADTYAISPDAVQTTRARDSKAVTAVSTGDCYAALATATSATAVNAGLLSVIDDQRFFPAFVVAPVVVADSVADQAAVAAALLTVAESLDSASLAALNARVAAGEDAQAVAESHLEGG